MNKEKTLFEGGSEKEVDLSDVFNQMRFVEKQVFGLLGEWNESHIDSDTEQVRRNIETMTSVLLSIRSLI